MKIQVISDVHLERNPTLTFRDLIDTNVEADVMVLAGDIGNPFEESYKNFINACSSEFKHVIVICGNHEYRCCMPMPFEQVDTIVRTFCHSILKQNVYFLNQGENKAITDINFIGATLWSKLPIDNLLFTQSLDAAWSGMNITNTIPFNVNTNNALFDHHLNKIEQAVKWGMQEKKKNVVITHHAPILKNCYNTEEYPKNHLYGNALEPYLNYNVAAVWIYGHTHWNTLSHINGTLVACNQYGGCNLRGFNKSFFVNI